MIRLNIVCFSRLYNLKAVCLSLCRSRLCPVQCWISYFTFAKNFVRVVCAYVPCICISCTFLLFNFLSISCFPLRSLLRRKKTTKHIKLSRFLLYIILLFNLFYFFIMTTCFCWSIDLPSILYENLGGSKSLCIHSKSKNGGKNNQKNQKETSGPFFYYRTNCIFYLVNDSCSILLRQVWLQTYVLRNFVTYPGLKTDVLL